MGAAYQRHRAASFRGREALRLADASPDATLPTIEFLDTTGLALTGRIRQQPARGARVGWRSGSTD